MSATSETKVAGMKLGAEPKKVAILAVLLAGAAGMFFYNSQSGGGDTSPSTAQTHAPAAPASAPEVTGTVHARARAKRRTSNVQDRGILRIQAIDPRNGDVDPTLRLNLLTRLQSIEPLEGGRSLFEMGPPPASAAQPLPKVTIIPKPVAATAFHPAQPVEPPFVIPLKFFGFIRPKNGIGAKRGFFLDPQNNVLVGSEGDVLEHKYLVVELTPSSAKLEDTQAKKGQTLPLIPEARNEF